MDGEKLQPRRWKPSDPPHKLERRSLATPNALSKSVDYSRAASRWPNRQDLTEKPSVTSYASISFLDDQGAHRKEVWREGKSSSPQPASVGEKCAKKMCSPDREYGDEARSFERLPRVRSALPRSHHHLTSEEEVVTHYNAAPTCKDAYDKMRRFHRDHLARDSDHRGSLSSQSTRRHEQNLISGLLLLIKQQQRPLTDENKTSLPSALDKLKLYAGTWDEVCVEQSSSSRMGELLHRIKRAYDSQLHNTLRQLATADDQHRQLVTCHELISEDAEFSCDDGEDDLEEEVEVLRDRIRKESIRNAELRKSLENEKRLARSLYEAEEEEKNKLERSFSYWRLNQVEKYKEQKKRAEEADKANKIEREERLQNLQEEILVARDTLAKEKKTTKEDFVPRCRVKQLEEAYNELEVELNDIRKDLANAKQRATEEKRKLVDLVAENLNRDRTFFSKISEEIEKIKIDENSDKVGHPQLDDGEQMVADCSCQEEVICH